MARRRIVTVVRCLEHGRPLCSTCERRHSERRGQQAARAPLTTSLGAAIKAFLAGKGEGDRA